MIPVHDSDAAAVLDLIEPGEVRHFVEVAILTIQEKAIPLAAAPGVTITHKLHEVRPAAGVVIDLFRGRHDLTPEEASQVIVARVGQVAIGDDHVLPAIVIKIGES